MVSFEHKADSLIAKFKEAVERSEGKCDGLEQSHRDYLHLVICIIVCLSWAQLIIAVITAITRKRPARQKCQNWSWRTRQLPDSQMRQRDVAALDAKYTKELADAKAENDALRDDVAAGRRRLHIKAVCRSVREATCASGVDNLTPRLANLRWTGLFHPQKKAITMQKQPWKEQKYINEQCR